MYDQESIETAIGNNKLRVAIIGAGPAGLCALKHLTTSSDNFEAVAFDRNFWPGGSWIYSDRTGHDEFGIPVHSAMYNTLRTNIPKELQEFPGFPYPKEWKNSYISRQQVFEYLNMFMDTHDLRKYVKTHTMVKDVHPIIQNGTKKVKWSVTYSDIRKYEEVTTEIFDAVFVCIGHHFKENVPDLPGMDIFKGRILHSRNYRHAEHFRGLRVAVLGCRFSGEDISVQVAESAKKVYICHGRTDMSNSFAKHIEQRPSFVRVTEKSVVFPDGSEQEVDAIIFCTGFNYSYPFLKDDIIQINNGRVTPVYKHMIHIRYPNLFFLNIPQQLAYFPHYHEMAKLAVRMLEGKVNLPSEKRMEEDSETEFQAILAEGKPPKLVHYMAIGDAQWRYNEVLAKMGGFKPLPPVLEMIWNDFVNEREMNLPNYKEINYVITGSHSYKCLNPAERKSTKSTAEERIVTW